MYALIFMSGCNKITGDDFAGFISQPEVCFLDAENSFFSKLGGGGEVWESRVSGLILSVLFVTIQLSGVTGGCINFDAS